MSKLDPRIWNPDETCEPCHMEILAPAGARFLGEFRVPDGLLCVLTSIAHASNGVSAKSSQGAVNITRGHRATNTDFFPVFQAQRWNGIFLDVFELTGGGSAFGFGKFSGFVIFPEAFTRSCRLVLDSDVWQIISLSGPIDFTTFILDGYCFPDLGR